MEEVRLAVLRALFFHNCRFIKEYNNDEAFPENWKMCRQCVLREMTWRRGSDSPVFQDDDLCFAIWHEDILNTKQN